MPQSGITSVLKEDRQFQPAKEFSERAAIGSMAEYHRLVEEARADPEKYWADRAQELLDWAAPWEQVLDWQPPHAKWFVGGKLNVAYNCVDRHAASWRKTKAAIIWEGEPGDTRVLTYQDLQREVSKFANVLKGQGVVAGDRVAIYMPMVPELAIAMLACARIGAVHTIIFGGFSAEALVDRINDARAKVVVTADGGFRRGNIVPLKQAVDDALGRTPSVKAVVVLERTRNKVHMEPGRDHWWHEVMESVSDDCPAVPLDSEHLLFILYTSGTTGKPKGVVHTTGGYLLNAALTSRWVFDLKDEDTYWCTADIGWITGHTYIVYGILANGATTVMYEGAPNHPEPDRFWEIVDKYQVNIFYTAPTAIRAFIKWGEQWPARHRLSSLRLLGTVGEPINPEAWMWYHATIGKGRCPIVDTWWQTETGGIMIAPLPGATPTRPGSATMPLPGIEAAIVAKDGTPCEANTGGYLIIKKPWPSMLRTVYGDDARYQQQYWSDVPGAYFTSDGARCDGDGYYWVMGRVDDVINVSGHRLGTMEVESALVSHPAVAEAAVVARPDEIKGSAIVAFVSLESGQTASKQLAAALRTHVDQEIGAIARPEEIRFADALPKTRSGKIMRRLLRNIATGSAEVGDVTTLEDAGILDKLRQEEE